MQLLVFVVLALVSLALGSTHQCVTSDDANVNQYDLSALSQTTVDYSIRETNTNNTTWFFNICASLVHIPGYPMVDDCSVAHTNHHTHTLVCTGKTPTYRFAPLQDPHLGVELSYGSDQECVLTPGATWKSNFIFLCEPLNVQPIVNVTSNHQECFVEFTIKTANACPRVNLPMIQPEPAVQVSQGSSALGLFIAVFLVSCCTTFLLCCCCRLCFASRKTRQLNTHTYIPLQQTPQLAPAVVPANFHPPMYYPQHQQFMQPQYFMAPQHQQVPPMQQVPMNMVAQIVSDEQMARALQQEENNRA